MMYTLEYQTSALEEMEDIVRYIKVNLLNPIAADRISELFLSKAESLLDMPYKYPVYSSAYPLTHEYRKMSVKKYVMFYYVDEAQKKIVIAKVLYARRNYKNQLE